MQFLDAHCHLHDSRVIADIPWMEKRARLAGVTHMASCATMEENFELTVQLSKDFLSVIPCFGIHPWFIETRSARWKENLLTGLTRVPSGIGETGIDFSDRTANREDQVTVFQYHLELARELGRPVNVHVRKAWDTFVHLIKKMGPLPAGGLIHSYSGSADMIPLFEKFNWHISFSGSVTRFNAKKVVRALQAVSPDRLLLETDSPDIYPSLPGHDIQGLNEPANLPGIARIAAQRRGIDVAVLAMHVWQNSMQVFSPCLKTHPS